MLLWRLAVISTPVPRPPTPFLRCLPRNAQDPFGRPIVVVKLSQLLGSPQDVRPALVQYMELLRLNLEAVNREREALDVHERPILQYIALIDIDHISMQSVVRSQSRPDGDQRSHPGLAVAKPRPHHLVSL